MKHGHIPKKYHIIKYSITKKVILVEKKGLESLDVQ